MVRKTYRLEFSWFNNDVFPEQVDYLNINTYLESFYISLGSLFILS